MARDSENLKLSESGRHEIQRLVDPAEQIRYRHLQWMAIGSSVSHIVAVFLAIYALRQGDLHGLSLVHLVDYVPKHTLVWQSTCLAIGASSLSYLFLLLGIRQVISIANQLWITMAVLVTVIGVTLDLQTFGTLAITFSDISTQLIPSSNYKQLLLMECWRIVNQSLTQSVIISNSLYAGSGLMVAASIITGVGMPKWLGWISIPVWLAGLAAAILTLTGQLTLAMVLMFAMTIAFIIWAIAVAVAIDPYTQVHRFPVEHHPAN